MKTTHFILTCLFTCFLLIIGSSKVLGDNDSAEPVNPVPPVKGPVSVTQDINELIVAFTQNIGTVTVSVEDASGNIMYETTITATAGSSLTIDTTGWDSGSYVLTVTDSSGTLYEIVVFVP